MAFTFKKGAERPSIARIKGGKKKNKILYTDTEPTRKVKSGMFRELLIHDGTIQPTFDKKKERQTYFIVGASGSGKSYFASSLIKEYKTTFSKNPVYLVSPKDYDPVLDKHNPSRIKLDEEVFDPDNNYLDWDQISNSMWIFDDCEGITDTKLKKLIYGFRDKLLTVGRSYRVSVISIHHLMLNNTETKTCLYESQSIVCFPTAGVNYQLNNYFQRYLGLKKDTIQRINDLPSRHVLIHQFCPRYVLSKDEGFLL